MLMFANREKCRICIVQISLNLTTLVLLNYQQKKNNFSIFFKKEDKSSGKGVPLEGIYIINGGVLRIRSCSVSKDTRLVSPKACNCDSCVNNLSIVLMCDVLI